MLRRWKVQSWTASSRWLSHVTSQSRVRY